MFAVENKRSHSFQYLVLNKVEFFFKEAIKCRHNEIANYIYENFLDQHNEIEKINNNFSKNVVCYSFHYHNFANFPDIKLTDNEFIFHYACKYDYFNIILYLLTTQKN